MQSKDCSNQQDADNSNVPTTAPSNDSILDRATAAAAASTSEVVTVITLSTGSIVSQLTAPVSATVNGVCNNLSNYWASWGADPNANLVDRVVLALNGLLYRSEQSSENAIDLSEDRILYNTMGGWNPEGAPTPSSEALRILNEQISAHREAERASQVRPLDNNDAVFRNNNHSNQELSYPAYQEPSQQVQQSPDTNLFIVSPLQYGDAPVGDTNRDTTIMEDMSQSDKPTNKRM